MSAHGAVIVGTGQGGFEVAASLRSEGFQEPITLVGEEPQIPYQRPPLSKGFVLGKQGLDDIELRPASFYRDHNITLVPNETVSAIDLTARDVRLASGARLPFDSLVLAVGARNRTLPLDGARLDGVLSLRTLNQAIEIKQRLQDARNVAVIGGGFIGLELAAVARTLGKAVTVLEALPRLMPRVVAPAVSDFYHGLHTSHGVQVIHDACVTTLMAGNGKVESVCGADGCYPADLALVGIGVVPNIELARDAGLPVGNGIVVDRFLETAAANVFAIGDCAEYPSVFSGAPARLESVQNAVDHARCVAAAIAGRRTPYGALPWFWTDQFDVRLQMAGLSHGYDRHVMRGDPESRKFSVFYFSGERLIAVDSINRPADHMTARRLLSKRVPVTPDQAADEGVDLKTLGR